MKQAPAGASVVYASEHVFERVSVAKDYEIKTEALRHGRGRVELPEVKGVMLAEIASGAMLTARGEVATQASLQRERRMVSTIDAGMGKYEELGRGREFVASDRLRPEQKAAVMAVLASRDLAFNMNGAAGTGKTATLQEVHRGLTEARRSVVAVAPTASAVEELQKVGFPQAMTVARLLADPKEQAQLAGQVLIVDEAGMVASKDMAELIRLAKGKGARILYSGDTAQIKSVSEGGGGVFAESSCGGLRQVRSNGCDPRSGLAASRSGSQQGLPRSVCRSQCQGRSAFRAGGCRHS